MSEKSVSVLEDERRVIRESIQELGDLAYDPMNRYGWGILESEAWNQLLLDLSSDARRIEREYQRKK
jgi:hypothetical protein